MTLTSRWKTTLLALLLLHLSALVSGCGWIAAGAAGGATAEVVEEEMEEDE